MNLRKILPALLVAGLFHAATALAQANATATRTLELSAFGAVSGVYTGFHGGKNFGVVAGVDLGLPVWRGISPNLRCAAFTPRTMAGSIRRRACWAARTSTFC